MSVTRIPAKELMRCDRCGKEGVQYEAGAFYDGGMHIRKALTWARGYDGGTGGGNVDYDFCGACLSDFERWLHGEKDGS